MKKDWKEYVRNIGGVDFRPLSMGSLTLLFDTNSPIVHGGLITAKDFAIFAWIHGENLSDVIASIKADNYETDAILWASEMPVEVYSKYTLESVKALNKDLNKIFIDKETGFIPFLSPSPWKPSLWRRVWNGIIHLLTFGLV